MELICWFFGNFSRTDSFFKQHIFFKSEEGGGHQRDEPSALQLSVHLLKYTQVKLRSMSRAEGTFENPENCINLNCDSLQDWLRHLAFMYILIWFICHVYNWPVTFLSYSSIYSHTSVLSSHTRCMDPFNKIIIFRWFAQLEQAWRHEEATAIRLSQQRQLALWALCLDWLQGHQGTRCPSFLGRSAVITNMMLLYKGVCASSVE